MLVLDPSTRELRLVVRRRARPIPGSAATAVLALADGTRHVTSDPQGQVAVLAPATP